MLVGMVNECSWCGWRMSPVAGPKEPLGQAGLKEPLGRAGPKEPLGQAGR